MKYTLILLCLSFFVSANAQKMTVRDVINHMLVALDTQIKPGSVDTLKSGNWDQEVTGIATTFMATLSVLKKAQAQGINLIITHEPTYYNHFDNMDEFGEKDPVVRAKEAFIKEHNLVVFRFHDVPHQIEDDMIKKGMIQKLGWQKHHLGDMVFTSPYKTVADLAQFLTDHFQTSTVRVVGDPKMKLEKFGFLPGAYGRHAQVDKFNNPEIDALIIGEGAEWEAIEYARDAQELGWRRALIVMGHAHSEEGGMEYVAEWLKSVVPSIPVSFIPAGNPLWTPSKSDY